MNLREIKELIELVDHSTLSDFEYEKDGERLVLRKPRETVSVVPAGVQVRQPSAGEPVSTVAEQPRASQSSDDGGELKSGQWTINAPMVGTFYCAPAPDADPFVRVGDTVEPGQTVCIIEAMKLMNEIESERRGRIVRVLAANGQAVEYGQALFVLEGV